MNSPRLQKYSSLAHLRVRHIQRRGRAPRLLTVYEVALYPRAEIHTPHGRGRIKAVDFETERVAVTFGCTGPDFDLAYHLPTSWPIQLLLRNTAEPAEILIAQNLPGCTARVNYWRSIGVDCDGLLASGKAIPLTTTNTTKPNDTL